MNNNQNQWREQKALKIIGDYTLTGTVLGKGQFGEVVLAKRKPTTKEQKDAQDNKQPNKKGEDQKLWMACKIIKKSNLNATLQRNLKSEISILSRIQSPHVIALHDIQKTANNFYLFMQYCNGGDLDDLRQLRGRFSEQEARYFIGQLLKGFKAINNMNVLHRDVKLANILVHFNEADSDMVLHGGLKYREFKKATKVIGKVDVIIADLGFAKQLQDTDLTKTMCGTPLYMAPEILKGQMYSSKVDVWSLGAVFYEMITGFTPFTGTNKDNLKENLEAGNYRFPKHIKMSLEGLDFLNCCLQHDPNERMDWDHLLKHNYVNYDYTKYMDDPGVHGKNANPVAQSENELLLSYNDESGIYSVIMNNDPHHQLNEQNAILLNTKNPMQYDQVYQKTIQKNFELIEEQKKNHVEEQINNIQQNDNDLGASQVMQKWDVQVEQNEDFDLLGGLGNNQIQANQNKQAGIDYPEDVDKAGFDSFTDNNFKQNKPAFGGQDLGADLDLDAVNKLAEQIKQKQNQQSNNQAQPPTMASPDDHGPDAITHLKEQNRERNMILQDQLMTPGGDHSKVLNQLIDSKADDVEENILNNLLGGGKDNSDGFEEIKKDDIIQAKNAEAKAINESILSAIDMGQDSFYPLVTEDPEIHRDYNLKIPSAQLDRVFDQKNKNQFNLQSVYINDNYVPQKKNK